MSFVSRLATTILCTLLLLAGRGLSVVAAPSNLDIDVFHLADASRSQIFAQPDRSSSSVKPKGVAGPYFAAGLVNNVQGCWYEVVWPVRGWVREVDAVFEHDSGRYEPAALDEERRIVMRLMSDIGSTPEVWRRMMGTPWAEDSFGIEREGTAFTVRTLFWPGVAIAVEQGGDDASPRLVRATLCGRVQTSFGPYALGESGEVLRRLDASVEPRPLAEIGTGDFRFFLDEDGKIDVLSYSAEGTGFLGCPRLEAPDPEEPFYPSSLYPRDWCPTRTLADGVRVEGEYVGVSCDEDCRSQVRLDSGATYDFLDETGSSMSWLNHREGARVSVSYGVDQEWDDRNGLCRQERVLKGGSVVGRRSMQALRGACRRQVVFTGEAWGEVSLKGGPDGAGWELVLDSGMPFAFRVLGRDALSGFETVEEGGRIGVAFERVLDWDDELQACSIGTLVRTAPMRR